MMEVQNLEAAAGLVIQVQQRNQHQQRTEQRVQEELDRRIDAVRAAPHADDEEHRDQHGFPEHIEQHGIQRRKHAIDQAGHDQEGRHVLRHAFLDHFPAGDHHQRREKAVEQDEQHRNAVHAQMVMDVEAADPVLQLDKLHVAGRSVEAGIQRQRHQKAEDGADQCDTARHLRIAIITRRQDQQAEGYRQPDGNA